jgi:hypothetical protein
VPAGAVGWVSPGPVETEAGELAPLLLLLLVLLLAALLLLLLLLDPHAAVRPAIRTTARATIDPRESPRKRVDQSITRRT